MNTFSDFNLPQELNQALERVQFLNPTPIQKQAIPVLIDGKDLMACAETGSGKTGAYLIPMISQLIHEPNLQGLILVPTRELAMQITEFLEKLMPVRQQFHYVKLIGGQDIRKQFRALQRKPRVIIATPGRLIDHLKRNTIQINKVTQVVLDEGDRMIDMGFSVQLEQILKYLPSEKQTAFFTATIDAKVQKLAQKYLNQPINLMLDVPKPVSKIKQTVIKVTLKEKDDCVLNELNERKGSVIVFLKTKHRTDRLKEFLDGYGFSVDLIHGGKSQGQRNRAIKAFKNGQTRILCATDVAARGIDVPHVEHVINFDLPMQDEDYVHRVGRTARNGAEGEAVTLVMPDEYGKWNAIVKKYEIPDAMIEGVRSSKENSRGKRRGGGLPFRLRKKYGEPKGESSRGDSRKEFRRGKGGSKDESRNDSRNEFRGDSRRTKSKDFGSKRKDSRSGGEGRSSGRKARGGFKGGGRSRSRQESYAR
ncbi:MAG: DEAD/DEAH box helicase [Bdellovibrionales bacterium]|nr:DEAD/DEAH box helicase [Bdellovibrionales bacterium]